MISLFCAMPFFRANFIFGGQKFAGKQDKDRSDNGERHGGYLLFAETETGVFLYVVKVGRCRMNLLAAKIYYDGSHWIAIPIRNALTGKGDGGNSRKRARNCSSSRNALKRSKAGERAEKQSYCWNLRPCSRTKMRRNSLWKNISTG